MFNTYGLRSVNTLSFNDRCHYTSTTREFRNFVVTLLRVHNIYFNIFGYMPIASLITGINRSVNGFFMIFSSFGVGVYIKKREHPLVNKTKHFLNELTITGVAQVFRGVCEMAFPFGQLINLSLDIIATPINVSKDIEGAQICSQCLKNKTKALYAPLPDANYPGLSKFLYLV